MCLPFTDFTFHLVKYGEELQVGVKSSQGEKEVKEED